VTRKYPSSPVRVTNYDDSGAASEGTLSAIKAQTDKLNFDGTKLKTDATLSGSITIAEMHITDPDTDLPANVISDGANNALVVVQNRQALTPIAPAAVSVGITSTSVLAANPDRKGLILTNTSPNYISLGFGAAAVLYSGVTLSPYGGVYVMDKYTYNQGTVTAIASAATSNLGVQEFE